MPRRSITLVVGNPTARTGKAKQAIDRAVELLDAAGLNAEFMPTAPEGKTVRKLADRLERGDVARVAYLGGDGTFAESAKGIILAREETGVDVPLAMLPMGTANDQGRSFGIEAGPKALQRNVDIIAEGVECWLDVGRIEAIDAHGEVVAKDLWFDNTGFGLSARILAQRNRNVRTVSKFPLLEKFYRDKVLYIGAGFASFFKSVAERVRFSCAITIDGETYEHNACTDVVINGTLLYGGDWIFYEDAQPDDGKFEVIVFNSYNDWARATIRSHKKNPITDDDREQLGITSRSVPQGKHIEVRIFRPEHVDQLPAQIDGEEFPSTDHYRVENLFHHLRVIVPEDRTWV